MGNETEQVWSDERIDRTVQEHCLYRVADTILCMSQGTAHGLLTEMYNDLTARLRQAERSLAVLDAAYSGAVDAIAKLEQERDTASHNARHYGAKVQGLEEERDALIRERTEIEQVLGAALGYPAMPDGGSGVCVGEHTAATIAQEAARRIGKLSQELAECKRVAGALSRTGDDIVKWRNSESEADNGE